MQARFRSNWGQRRSLPSWGQRRSLPSRLGRRAFAAGAGVVLALAAGACTGPPAAPAPDSPTAANTATAPPVAGSPTAADTATAADAAPAAAPATVAPPAAAPAITGNGVAIGQVIRTACGTQGRPPSARLIRSDQALASRLAAEGVAAEVASEVANWEVAWDRGQAVLLVQAGRAPNPLYVLVVDSITRPATGALQVKAHLRPPARGTIAAQVIANPCQLVRLDGLDGYAGSSAELALSR